MAEQQMTPEQCKELEEKLKKMSPDEIAELQKQQCIFCQIISGKIPSKKVYDDEHCIVVMDINPATRGHCLLLPKKHFAIMPQIPENILDHLFIVSKAMSKILLKSMRVDGTNIFVANGAAAGQRAPHFMIHIIPRKEGDKVMDIENHLVDLGIRQEIAEKIENRFNELMGIKKKVIKQKTLKEVEKEVEELDSGDKDEPEEEDFPEAEEDDDKDDNKKVEQGSDEDSDEEEPDEDDDSEDEKDDGDASLDDIANLFK
ncbi:MAG: HIT domain-containing protein [archaeon]|nr:HIT domain-containing protein [Nanoarchaeota archaeon]